MLAMKITTQAEFMAMLNDALRDLPEDQRAAILAGDGVRRLKPRVLKVPCQYCDKPSITKAMRLCWAHYARIRRHGTPADPPPTVAATFWDHVDKSGGPDACWIWLRSLNSVGYGVLHVTGNRHEFSHRYAWELANGTIAPGMTIDHLCYETLCCNPRHLEVVTLQENIRRRRPACASGTGKTQAQKLVEARARQRSVIDKLAANRNM